MNTSYPGSKVEVKGFIARHYDAFMNVITLGKYPSFIEECIKLMGIKPENKIIDFGVGTGRNSHLMLKYLSLKGELTGVDNSNIMIAKFKKKCAPYPNAKIINNRIDEPLNFKEEFDKVFISFVLHGFPQNVRETIIDNAYKALNNNGEFHILDWNESGLNALPFHQWALLRFIECPYTFDFIKRDWKKILTEKGFTNFEEHFFFGKFIRLLKARKDNRNRG